METYKQFIARKHKEFEEEKNNGTLKKFKRRGSNGNKHYHHWKLEKWTMMVQTNLKEKVFIIEKLRLAKSDGPKSKIKIGDVQYRIGYYIIGKRPRSKNKWVWGQYCPIFPVNDFQKLLKKARREGFLTP